MTTSHTAEAEPDKAAQGTIELSIPVEAPPSTSRPTSGADPASELTKGTIVWRFAAHSAWIAALAALLVARIGRFGFNPTDQGFMLSLSWRVLNGAIPHVDLISPRPLGSAYLHTLDFLLPAPLFIASGFVATVEVIVATVACAALLTQTSPLRWGPMRTLLVATAAVINMHTFPMMAWHTIDGIFLTAVGWWRLDAGLRSGSAWSRRIGLVLLGFAVMTKQSFMFAVPVAVLLLLFHPSVRRDGRRWGRTIVDLLFLGSIPIVYAAFVTVAGGLQPMIDQLTGGVGAWGQNLYDFWYTGDAVTGIRRNILLVAAGVAVAVVLWLARRKLGGSAGWLRVAPLAGMAAFTIYALAEIGLSYPVTAGVELLWFFLGVVVLDAVAHKHLPWRPLLVALLAYMSSLSWGYNVPGLLAGTLALGILDLLVRAAPEIELKGRAWLVPQALLGVVALVAASVALVNTHDRGLAIDRPQDELTVDLGTVTPSMSGIRTTPVTAAYVRQIRDCLQRYPAAKVAVLPDSPFVYPAFKLQNPFPLDWPLPLELVADAPQRMMDTVRQLNREGDYLVLFQTRSMTDLRDGKAMPTHVRADKPVYIESGLESQIRDGLTGKNVSCGSLVGVYAPRR
jgi:hypothetical protein